MNSKIYIIQQQRCVLFSPLWCSHLFLTSQSFSNRQGNSATLPLGRWRNTGQTTGKEFLCESCWGCYASSRCCRNRRVFQHIWGMWTVFYRTYMEEMILVVHNSIVFIFKLQDDYVTMDFQLFQFPTSTVSFLYAYRFYRCFFQSMSGEAPCSYSNLK